LRLRGSLLRISISFSRARTGAESFLDSRSNAGV
jgi:hypothetical protein